MPLLNLRALRVSVVKQDVLPLQGHCLNRSEPVAFPPKTTKAQHVVTIAFDDAASTNPSTISSLPDFAFKTTLPVHSYALPLNGLLRQNHRNALSNEVTNWIPEITFWLNRSSFVINRLIRVDAAQLREIASGGRIVRL